MLKVLFFSLFFSLICIPSYGRVDLFLNQDGIVNDTASCRESRTKSSPFSFALTKKSESNSMKIKIASESLKFNYVISEGSLVSIVSNFTKQNYKLIRVLSYQGERGVELSSELLGRRGTIGIIKQSNLISLKEREISISKRLQAFLSENLSLENKKLTLEITSEKDFYLVHHCKQEEYILFSVYAEGDLVRTIGISREASNFLAHLRYKAVTFDNLENEPALFKERKLNPFSYIVCSEKDRFISVYDKNIEKTFFRAKGHEPIIPIQTFSESSVAKEDGDTYKYYQEVKFPNRPGGRNSGWIDRDLILLPHECRSAGEGNPFVNDPDQFLDSIFPTLKRVVRPYDEGARSFGARRGGGKRLHAGNDLYRLKDDPVVAVNNGRIIRSLYYFYLDTYAIEVKHSNGQVARYGEITAQKPGGQELSIGTEIKRQDLLGFVGKVNSDCCHPMLHFELFSGKGAGALSRREAKNKYKRRWDLLNPTNFLKEWELNTLWH